MQASASVYVNLSPATQRVLDALIYFSQWKTFRCWASQETIAKKAECSKRSVERALAILVEIGYGTYTGGGHRRNKTFQFSSKIKRIIQKIKAARHGKYAQAREDRKKDLIIPDCLNDLPITDNEKQRITLYLSSDVIENGTRVLIGQYGSNISSVQNIYGFIKKAGEERWEIIPDIKKGQPREKVAHKLKEHVCKRSIPILTKMKNLGQQCFSWLQKSLEFGESLPDKYDIFCMASHSEYEDENGESHDKSCDNSHHENGESSHPKNGESLTSENGESLYNNYLSLSEKENSSTKHLENRAAASLFDGINISESDKTQLIRQCNIETLKHGIKVYSALSNERKDKIREIAAFIRAAGEEKWPIKKSAEFNRQKVIRHLGHLNGTTTTTASGIKIQFIIMGQYVEFNMGVHSKIIPYDDKEFDEKIYPLLQLLKKNY